MQRFEAYEDDNGDWRWRLWAADFELVAGSGEAFSSQAEALLAAEAAKGVALDAGVESAPGLGMKAARRLRALLSGEPGDALGTVDADVGATSRTAVRPAARPVAWFVNRRIPTAGPSIPASTLRGRSPTCNRGAWTTTSG